MVVVVVVLTSVNLVNIGSFVPMLLWFERLLLFSHLLISSLLDRVSFVVVGCRSYSVVGGCCCYILVVFVVVV